MSDTPLHSVSVAGVVSDDLGQILMIKRRDSGEWEIPGGVLELGETFEKGVAREILEETGVEVGVERLTGVYKNLPRAVVALVYRCRLIGGEGRCSSEAREVSWLTPDAAMSYMAPAFAIRVADAMNLDNGSASRAHDGVNLAE